MKIVVIGDIFVKSEELANAAQGLNLPDKKIVQLKWNANDKKEFQKRALNIERNGPEAEEPPHELFSEIEDTDILMVHFAPISRKIIERGKKLKLVGTCRGGLEHIDVKAATENNIPVIHVIRNAEPVADYTLGLIFSETRNIARSHHAIKLGSWRKQFENSNITTTLREQKVGIVGLGHIGSLVAKKLNSLGVEVLGYDPFVSEENLKEKGIKVEKTSLEELFRNSDIITLHLRLTEKTKNMINRNLISLMKPTAYLVNTARAGIVDEEALIDALLNKKIAGAALDVFWEEPIPKEHPLLKLDNVTLTSHIAGDTVDAIPKSPKLLKEAINQYLEKGKSDLVVNLENLESIRRGLTCY